MDTLRARAERGTSQHTMTRQSMARPSTTRHGLAWQHGVQSKAYQHVITACVYASGMDERYSCSLASSTAQDRAPYAALPRTSPAGMDMVFAVSLSLPCDQSGTCCNHPSLTSSTASFTTSKACMAVLRLSTPHRANLPPWWSCPL